MPDPRTYLLELPNTSRPNSVELAEDWYPGVKDYWSHSTSSRIFDSILGIRAVVIHATAGVTSEGAMSVMKAGNASWHWLVPDEDEAAHGRIVWACAPEARAAWHVRNSQSHPAVNDAQKRVNHWSLGIEIVNSQRSDQIDPFSEWQVAVTARIVRYCWAKYPNLKQVVSHAVLDPQRRTDPGPHFPWAEFSDLVLSGSDAPRHASILASVADMSTLPKADKSDTCCAGMDLP